jgi:hypothetical protein
LRTRKWRPPSTPSLARERRAGAGKNGNGPVGNLRGFAARLVPRRKVIVNNPNRSGYDFPWWAALILLMIFGITMFLSGYLVGRMY